MNNLIQFFRHHVIIANLALMAVVSLVLIWVLSLFMGLWTGHGDVRTVPNINGMSLAEARNVLGGSDLSVEVTDSLYNPGALPGAIIEQNPPAGNTVKPGRTVYVITNAYNPPEIAIPPLVGTPLRQARATLQNLGFKKISEERVASDYKDLVIAVKSMGVSLRAGTKLPQDSPIVIEVGEGYVAPVDTIGFGEEFEDTQQTADEF